MTSLAVGIVGISASATLLRALFTVMRLACAGALMDLLFLPSATLCSRAFLLGFVLGGPPEKVIFRCGTLRWTM